VHLTGIFMIIDQPVTVSERAWHNIPLITIFEDVILTHTHLYMTASGQAITESEFGVLVQLINSNSASLQ